MKKDAEEAYASVLMEVAKYAAEVKLGTVDIRLKAKDTFASLWLVTISFMYGTIQKNVLYLPKPMKYQTKQSFGQVMKRTEMP